jgi:hypothetical protein
MSEIRVSVRLRGFDLHYEGSLAFFERVVDPLLAQAAPYPKRGSGPREKVELRGVEVAPAESGASLERAATQPATPVGYRPTSPEFRAFLQRLGPEAAEPDRQVLSMAFYLWNYEKKDHVREDEVEGCFRTVGLAPPVGLESICSDLAQRLRFLLPGPEPHTWTLTQNGANYVKTRLLGAM